MIKKFIPLLILPILVLSMALVSSAHASPLAKDCRFTNVNFVPMDPGPDGILGTSDDEQLPAELGTLLPDSDGDGKFDVLYVLKKDGRVASTNPGQLYCVISISGEGITKVSVSDAFDGQFDVKPAKLGGGVEVIVVDGLTGLATVLTDTPAITSATVDNVAGTVDLSIDLSSGPTGPLDSDDTLMIYIKFQTALKFKPPNLNDWENTATVDGVPLEPVTATIEFV